jgi:acetyltransferase-like isoleucine patch superfamily enzyme
MPVRIVDDVVIGAGSVVTKDIITPGTMREIRRASCPRK